MMKIMRLLLLFILLIVSKGNIVAMQPTQWFRTAQESLEIEEELAKQQQELLENEKLLQRKTAESENELVQETKSAQAKIAQLPDTIKKAVKEAATQELKEYYEKRLFGLSRIPNYEQTMIAKAQQLLNLGADPHVGIPTGCVLESNPPIHCETTILNIALGNQFIELAQLLINYGAVPNNSDLYYAINESHPEVVRFLVRSGVNPNESFRGFYPYKTPLTFTVEKKDQNMFNLLLELGADPYAKYVLHTWFNEPRYTSTIEVLKEYISENGDVRSKTLYEQMLKSIDEYSKKAKVRL